MSDVSGQEVPAEDLPNGVQPTGSLSGQEVPPEDMPSMSGQEVPLSDLPPEAAKQVQYSTTGEQIGAGIEGLLRGVTAGLSVPAEVGLGKLTGIKELSPEAIKAREEVNPWISTPAQMAGTAGLLWGTGGLAAPIEAGIGGATGAALGFGLESAGIGAGNIVAEKSLGNPDLNAEKIVSHLGLDFVLGAGLGALTRPFRSIAEKTVSAATEATGAAEEAVGEPLLINNEKYEPVTSWENLKESNAKLVASGKGSELPQKQSLVNSLNGLPDVAPIILPQQVEQLGSLPEKEMYLFLRDSDTSVGNEIQTREAIQKNILTKKIDETIQSIVPGKTQIINDIDAGEVANNYFKKAYGAIQNELKPFWQALDKAPIGTADENIQPLMEKFEEYLPGISQMFKYGEDGSIQDILPHNSGWGISDEAYGAVKKVFNDMENFGDEPATLQTFLNFRKGISEKINMTTNPGVAGQLKRLGAGFMNHIQDLANDYAPEGDLLIRNGMKRYALNELDRQVIEKTFQGNIGGEVAAGIQKGNVANVLKRIFSTKESIDAAKRILPKEQFNELLMHHMAGFKDYVTSPEGVFSTPKFSTQINKINANALNEAFSENPAILQRIRDLTNVSKIIPDAARLNPSGTARTISKMLDNSLQDINLADLATGIYAPKYLAGRLGSAVSNSIAKGWKGYRAQKDAVNAFNNGLAGKAAKEGAIKGTHKMLSIINSNIDRSTKSLFDAPEKEEVQ